MCKAFFITQTQQNEGLAKPVLNGGYQPSFTDNNFRQLPSVARESFSKSNESRKTENCATLPTKKPSQKNIRSCKRSMEQNELSSKFWRIIGKKLISSKVDNNTNETRA